MASIRLHQQRKMRLFVLYKKKNYWSTDSGMRRQRNLMANPLHYSTLRILAVRSFTVGITELQYHQELL